MQAQYNKTTRKSRMKSRLLQQFSVNSHQHWEGTPRSFGVITNLFFLKCHKSIRTLCMAYYATNYQETWEILSDRTKIHKSLYFTDTSQGFSITAHILKISVKNSPEHLFFHFWKQGTLAGAGFELTILLPLYSELWHCRLCLAPNSNLLMNKNCS